MKKILAILLVLPNLSYALPTAKSVASTQPGTTQIMQPTDIHSSHTITITNDQDKSAMFYWTMTLCPDTQPDRCQTINDHLGLSKGQRFTKTYYITSTIVFRAIGSKSITAKTEITGAVYSVAYDQKYVDVHY